MISPFLVTSGRFAIATLKALLCPAVLTVMSGFGQTAAPIQLASPSLTASRSAHGASTAPTLSGDGGLVVFTSDAPNLVTNDVNGTLSDVFARDLPSGSVQLISVATNGLSGNAPSHSPVVSADGRFVAFVSSASNLVPGDTNQHDDIFLRDRAAGLTSLISVDTAGFLSGSGPSDSPTLTPDGRFVVFQSWATNLVARDTNGVPDIFLRDSQSGTTLRVSAPAKASTIARLANGPSKSAVVSADGSRIVYLSDAANLAPAPRNNASPLIVYDRATGTNRVIDLLPASVSGQKIRAVGNPTLSTDGQWVTVYVEPPRGFGTPGLARIHLGPPSDRVESVAPTLNTQIPFLTSSDASGPYVSEDGQIVVFEARPKAPTTTTASTAPPGVFAWSSGNDPVLLSTNQVLYDPIQAPRGLGELLAASASAEFVAYSGYQPAAIEPTLASPLNLWIVHRPSLESRRITREGVSEDSPMPSFSADGHRVAFVSADPGLVPDDLNGAPDVFVYDWASRSVTLVSATHPSLRSNTDAAASATVPSGLSPDGRWLLFHSLSPNLATPDTNHLHDLFLRDLSSGTTRAISVGEAGSGTGSGASTEAALSDDGRIVAFISTSTNLAGPAGNRAANVFLRDTTAATTRLLSAISDSGQPARQPCSQVALSPDGRYAAFITLAALLPADQRPSADLYLFDTTSGSLQLITTNANPVSSLFGVQDSGNPRWSPDGRWLVFESLATGLTLATATSSTAARWHARDVAAGTTFLLADAGTLNARTLTEAPQGASISGDSTSVALAVLPPTAGVAPGIVVRRLASPETIAAVTNARQPRLNGNATRLAYRVSPPAGSPATHAVRVLDITSQQTLSVDVAQDGTPANAPTRFFEIDAEGRFVFFTSTASNLHPGAVNGQSQLFARDLASNTTLLVSVDATGQPANRSVGAPVISRDGRTLAFTTLASNLDPSDFNGRGDAYVVRLNSSAGGDAPVIAISRAGTGEITLIWSAIPDARYRVEFKNALEETTWTSLGSADAAHGPQATLVDRSAGTTPQRIYRVVRE